MRPTQLNTTTTTTTTSTPAEKCCIINGALNAIYLFKLDTPKTDLFLIFCIFYFFELFADAGVVKTLDTKFRVPFLSLRLSPLLSRANLESCSGAFLTLVNNLAVLLYAQRSIEEIQGGGGGGGVDDLAMGLNATTNGTDIIDGY